MRLRNAWRCIVAASLVLFASPAAGGDTYARTTPELCAEANIVVVVSVTDVTSAWQSFPFGDIITSDVEFSVLRQVHGQIPTPFTLHVSGGEVSGQKLYTSDAPFFKTNERYLLALRKVPGIPARIVGGRGGAVRLDPTATLPSNATLQAEWAEVCDAP